MNTLKKIILAATMATGAFLVYKYVDDFSVDERLLTSEQVKTILAAREKLTSQEHRQARKYAIVINGDLSPLHKGNVTDAFATLMTSGYSQDNIFLLTSNFPDGRSPFSITARGSEENLLMVFNYLDGVIDSNDTLVVYTTGHGGDSTLALADSEINIFSDLRNLIRETKAGEYILIADQCYSGAVVEMAKSLEGKVVAYSDIDANHSTYCESFARPFWDSFRTLSADSNNDGIIQLDEAFTLACANHRKESGDQCQAYHSQNPPTSL